MHEVCISHSMPRACMGTARMKQEVGADTRIIVKEYHSSMFSKHLNRKFSIHIEG